MANETEQQQDLSEQQLADMAASLDATGGVEVPVQEAQPTEPTPGADAEKKPDDANPEKDAADPAKKTEPTEPAKEPGTEAAEESKYSKAQKEQERRERSWQKLDEEKAALRKEREELEAERKKTATVAEEKDERGFSATDYDNAAKNFDASGDAELARKAREQATRLREATQSKQGEAKRTEFLTSWNGTVKEIVEARPELKDDNAPVSKRVREVLKNHPQFSMVPDGFRRAVEYADTLEQAASVPGYKTEIEKLTKEIERLNKLTSVGGSGPTSRPGASKSITEMTTKEAEAELTRLAEEADRQAA